MKIEITLIIIYAMSLLMTSCNSSGTTPSTLETVANLIEILEDPQSPEFSHAVNELAKMGPSASSAAPILSLALTYPRRDSYIAGKVLIEMGPEAELAIPNLITALKDPRPEVRRYAALALGSIGRPAKCAIPEIAKRLWDPDPWVRSASAISIESIITIDLVADTYKASPASPGAVAADDPQGKISGQAQTWWSSTGQNMDWSDTFGRCAPNIKEP
jgi:HEAT repeat protein